MSFADLHSHALWGVDDGAQTPQQMQQMVDAACADGVAVLCLTPHFHPGYFGENQTKVGEVFQELTHWAAEKHPGLRLYLGNELRYSPECLTWLKSGACRTLGGTDYVLVDFDQTEPGRSIVRGLQRLLSAGYRPVLAHAERYGGLTLNQIRELSDDGVWIQMDVQSLFGVYGLGARLRSRALLKKKLVDIVATDAHGMGRRSPILSRGYRDIVRKYGEAYAGAVFAENPLRLLEGEDREGANDRE